MSIAGSRILVTGSTGLIGSHLVPRLAAMGARVRATIHSREPSQRIEGVEYLKADLTRTEDCTAATKDIDYVYHCASIVMGAAATAANPLAALNGGTLINIQVLDAAYRANVKKFLWLGSTVAYPDKGSTPLREDEVLEGEPFSKYFAVGWMKRYSDVLCQIYGQKLSRLMTTIVLRPTNVYGPGDKFDPANSHVAAALLRKVVERKDPIEVWGTGDDVRDLIYVEDVVRAMILAMEKLDTYTTLNIGLGKGYSVKQILQTLLEVEGHRPSKVVFDPSKPSMIPIRLVDVSKARKVLGFSAEIDLKEGLRQTLDWYKKSPYATS